MRCGRGDGTRSPHRACLCPCPVPTAACRQVENIGARRLHTVIERIMDDISYGASDMSKGSKVVVDKELVKTKLAPMLAKTDLSKFIL